MSRYGVGSLRKNLQHDIQEVTDNAVMEAHVSGSRLRLSQSLGTGRSSFMRGSICRQVIFKVFAYVCVWLLTWIFYVPAATLLLVFNSSNPPRALLYMLVIFQPLQGLYNLAIYMHPKIPSAKRKSKGDNNVTWWRAFVTAFWSKGSNRKKRGRRNSAWKYNVVKAAMTNGIHYADKRQIALDCRTKGIGNTLAFTNFTHSSNSLCDWGGGGIVNHGWNAQVEKDDLLVVVVFSKLLRACFAPNYLEADGYFWKWERSTTLFLRPKCVKLRYFVELYSLHFLISLKR